MNIKKGDNIIVLAGKDKGKSGTVLRSFPKENRVLIEGVNVKKKHLRPRKKGDKGSTVSIPHPIDVSNVRRKDTVKKKVKK